MDEDHIDKDLILELAKLLNETGLTEIDWGRGDLRIKVSKANQTEANAATKLSHGPTVSTSKNSDKVLFGAEPESNKGTVKSPMVGTVFLSPEPGAKPFVSVGDNVSIGQTLLIVEAMKTMNPIIAPIEGKIIEILVNDETPVEFGEILVLIE